MARYVEGDTKAFEALFQRYEQRAYAFFLKRTGARHRAEDLYQELFLRIHRSRDRYDPSRPFSPWLFQIAHNLLVDDSRRAFRGHEVSIEGHEAGSRRSDREAEIAAIEEAAHLIASLSPEERYVVLSTRLEGIGHAELAGRLGKSEGAVKKMASRAVRRLRDKQLTEDLLAPSR
ncbi:MAG TPA: sigma-70 family RNA polymerase sigma factor [Myxococcota bacterium]|nr:sigma-70 family RNA polymerase sigma factor [Myxococcota bacterium]